MSRTYVDIEAVKEVLADVKDCEDKQYALALLEWAVDKRTISETEIIADERKKFAEKIKSHMIMYCQGRSEQQYCASEIIDYIGKLMGEEDFSVDVEKEMEEHDKQIRAAGRHEFTKWLEENSYRYIDSFWQGHSIGEALEDYEKEYKKWTKN